jgi:hypothetical protein
MGKKMNTTPQKIKVHELLEHEMSEGHVFEILLKTEVGEKRIIVDQSNST